MTMWPNWADLVIVIFLVRASYVGLVHGLLIEILCFLSAVTVSALTINYWSVVNRYLQKWTPFSQQITEVIACVLLFLTLILIARMFIRSVNTLFKWEQINGFIQGVSFLVGAFRGLWWAGILLLALSMSGLGGIEESIAQRSIFASELVPLSNKGVRYVASRFPGARYRTTTLIPSVKRRD